MPPSDASGRIRTFLLATLVLGLLGMGAELLLIGHAETMQQRIPLVMLGLSVATAGWHAVAPKRATVRTLQAVMTLCILSGVVGVGLRARQGTGWPPPLPHDGGARRVSSKPEAE
jgi:hypothetical protein